MLIADFRNPTLVSSTKLTTGLPRVFLDMPDTIWEDLRKEINSQIDHFTYPMKPLTKVGAILLNNLGIQAPKSYICPHCGEEVSLADESGEA
jgi:uncharacterized Zn-finger protein